MSPPGAQSGSRGRRPARGFTLVEAVATMSIIAVVSVVASRSIFAAADAYASAATRAELSGSLSAALDRLSTDLRAIPFRPETSPTEPFLDSLTPTSIAWSNGTGFSLSGTDLLYTSGGASSILLENVSSLSLQAFDAGNSELGENLSGNGCDAVRRVQITISATRFGVTETLRTRVFLRCMMAGAAP